MAIEMIKNSMIKSTFPWQELRELRVSEEEARPMAGTIWNGILEAAS